ncbi:cuticle protein 5-like [Homalodisca vitripennis]|uniref:cuticle protein 5-like n=1 Tax=Homalodisca vitripennis TaxID=197043 RepID=UPI001EEC104D|nr:cuticle protein 5-like [Homalodisca vitripennis]
MAEKIFSLSQAVVIFGLAALSSSLAAPGGLYQGYHGPQAIPHVLPSGHLADTHEVAAAKAEHFRRRQYHGPIAIPHVLHDGHIADTHEVAAAKAEHFAAVAKAQAHAGHGDHGDYHGDDGRYAGGYDSHSGFSGAYHGGSGYVGAYHGPLAKPVVLPSGYLADTHDVAAARGHHYQALAQAHHHSSGDEHYHH